MGLQGVSREVERKVTKFGLQLESHEVYLQVQEKKILHASIPALNGGNRWCRGHTGDLSSTNFEGFPRIMSI